MDETIVIGGGGHAKVVISILKKLKVKIVGYTDLQDRGELLGVPYVGTDQAFVSRESTPAKCAVIAVGQVGLGNSRCDLRQRLESADLSFPLIVSPNAIVNEQVSCGEATVVMDGAVVNPGAVIGRGVILNTNCTVEHDVTIEDWVHVAPGATISGGVTVGRYSMVGVGATIIEGVRIVAGTLIGAGTTVVNDILEPGVYVGCPARRIK